MTKRKPGSPPLAFQAFSEGTATPHSKVLSAHFAELLASYADWNPIITAEGSRVDEAGKPNAWGTIMRPPSDG